ncbi:MAG: 2-succinyl-5-enolpyruvyl-6-hydroxy-3-cyclohexene-1-carboxylic-acid synthase [Myxococcota bacterium]
MPDTLNQRWAATLVGALARGGVRHAVVAPGSRSTPLALAFADRPDVKTWSIHDERSAGFFALGLSQADDAPVAVVCTSGTAGAHFLPAAMEAHAAGAPLVLLTADRPWALRGFGAPQTTEQAGLFGRFAVDAAELPDPVDRPEALAHLAAVTARTLARGLDARAPVHLNVPFDEPLAPASAERGPVIDPPATRFVPSRRVVELSLVRDAVAKAQRGVIVVGPRARADGFGAAVHRLGARLHFPVLAEAASNARYGFDGAVAMVDALLRAPAFADAMRPDVVLRFGGGLTPKGPQAWLDGSGARTFAFAEDERFVDPLHRAEAFLVGDLVDACDRLETSSTPAGWRQRWLDAEARARRSLALWREGGCLTEPSVAHTVVASLPPGASLVVSSSMPIRDVDAFAPAAAPIRVFSNRGVNGIDGVTSTALGIAAATNTPTALLVGDVALLHDLSAWVTAKRHGVPLTVVVLNNDGGGIFHFLPVADRTPHFEALFGTPHGVELSAVAALGGATLHRPTDVAGLKRAVAAGLEGGLHLVEVRTRRDENVTVHRDLLATLAREVA